MKKRYRRVFVLLFLLCSVPSQGCGDDQLLRSAWDAAVVGGTVNDQHARLLLDTGADGTGIEIRLLTEMRIALQRERKIRAPSGTTQVRFYEPIGIGIDGFETVRVTPGGIELAGLNLGGHVSFDGLVGMDVLNRHTVLISRGIVSLRERVPAEFPVVETFDTGDRVEDRADLPVSMSEFGVREFRVDTGMTDACQFNDRLVKDMLHRGALVRGSTAKVTDIRGAQIIDRFVLRELTVAGVKCRNVPVSTGQYNAIGLELLRHMNLALDFPRRQILIGKPPQDVVDRFAINASGMAVGFDAAEALKVLAIRPDSPAETAGVQPGDVIVQLDGRNPAELSIYDIHDILARDSKTISVVFCRGQDEHYIELPLQLPFEYPPNWAALDARQKDFEKFLEKLESDPAPAAKP